MWKYIRITYPFWSRFSLMIPASSGRNSRSAQRPVSAKNGSSSPVASPANKRGTGNGGSNGNKNNNNVNAERRLRRRGKSDPKLQHSEKPAAVNGVASPPSSAGQTKHHQRQSSEQAAVPSPTTNGVASSETARRKQPGAECVPEKNGA